MPPYLVNLAIHCYFDLCLKIDLVSHPARVEGLVNIYNVILLHEPGLDIKKL